MIFGMRWLLGDSQFMKPLLDLWIANITLSQWLTFISSKMTNSIRIYNLFHPNGKAWDPAIVAHLFREQQGEHMRSMAILIHNNQDVRVYGSSYTSRAMMANLYRLYQREPTSYLNVGCI